MSGKECKTEPVSDRDNILDPDLYLLKSGVKVWVTKKLVTEEIRYSLIPHEMKEDLKIWGPTTSDPHVFDPCRPRVVADPSMAVKDLIIAFRGRPVVFDASAAPLITRVLPNFVATLAEFSVQDLVYEDYSIVSTGNDEWPFIVFKTNLLEYNYQE